MKRILSIFCCVLVILFGGLMSCAPLSQTPSRQIKLGLALINPVGAKGLTYSDESIGINFGFDQYKIDFNLTNKTDRSMKLNWNEASFVTTSGRNERIMHSGTIKLFKDSPQSPSVIAPNSILSDFVIPSCNWPSDMRHILPLFSENDIYSGAQFGILLPLEIKNEVKEYNFIFRFVER